MIIHKNRTDRDRRVLEVILMQMTREKLKQYRALKKEIEKLDKDIDKLYEKNMDIPTVKGKVTGSSKDFPYIQTHMTVEMQEPREADLISRRIRIKRKRKEEAEQQAFEIERFISNIPDSTDRQIFEMMFLDGKKQKEISEDVGLERSGISKRISRYL
ncbi:MAG: sigma-70 family RNA polymerase sigma factor [Hominisplanchenecus sp.]